jgi:hypothetical protein
MPEIKYNEAFNELLFSFAKEHGFSSQDIADEMGKTRVVISNWRSKCTPPGHRYACQAFMDNVLLRKIVLKEEL